MSLLVRRGVAHGGAGLSGTAGEYDIDLNEVEESLTQLTISVSLTWGHSSLTRHTSSPSSGLEMFL
jgi:hypothetical protein